LGRTPTLYRDAHHPCPKGRKLLEGVRDLRVRGAQYVFQLCEFRVLVLMVLRARTGLFEVPDRPGHSLSFLRDVYKTLGRVVELRE
jgi:hypothetical protein